MHYVRDRPGELVHVDVKQLASVPDGGGWRIHGRTRDTGRRQGAGYVYTTPLSDDHSHVVHPGILTDETGCTPAESL